MKRPHKDEGRGCCCSCCFSNHPSQLQNNKLSVRTSARSQAQGVCVRVYGVSVMSACLFLHRRRSVAAAAAAVWWMTELHLTGSRVSRLLWVHFTPQNSSAVTGVFGLPPDQQHHQTFAWTKAHPHRIQSAVPGSERCHTAS